MQHSLKNKIILSITLIIFVFGGLAITSVFFYSRDEIKKEVEQDLATLSSGIANNTAQILNHISLTAKSISQREEIIEYLDSGAEERQESYILQELEEHNIGNIYSAIYLMLPDGTTVASTDKDFVGKNYGFRGYFQDALAGRPATDIVLGVTSGKLGYYFAHPVRNTQAEIIGVAVTKLKPEVISNAIAIREEEDLGLSLVDNYGVIIFSTKKSKMFGSLGQLSGEERKAIEEGRRFTGIDIKPLDYNLLQQAIYSVDDTQVFEIYDEALSVTKIDGYPFFLVLDRNLEDLVSSSVNLAYILSGFVLVAALFAIISLTYLISVFMRPLQELQDAVEKIGRGNLDYKIESSSEDEMGKLAQAFNKMVIAIKQSRAEVDKKVTQQTEELAKQKKEAENAANLANSTTEAMAGRELKMIELKKEIMELKNKLNGK